MLHLITVTSDSEYCKVVFIGSKSLSWKYSTGQKMVLTCSASTLPKVNGNGWNLEHFEHIVGGWPWQILGAIRIVATVWQAAKFFVDSTHFSSDKFYDIWTKQCQLVLPCKFSEQNFENFTVKVVYKKRKNCSQNFQILRLQAVITLQWLQIARNSLPNWPSRGCLVSIFTVRINSKSFPWATCSIQEAHPHFFRDVHK